MLGRNKGSKLNSAEIWMLRWVRGKTRLAYIRNDDGLCDMKDTDDDELV